MVGAHEGALRVASLDGLRQSKKRPQRLKLPEAGKPWVLEYPKDMVIKGTGKNLDDVGEQLPPSTEVDVGRLAGRISDAVRVARHGGPKKPNAPGANPERIQNRMQLTTRVAEVEARPRIPLKRKANTHKPVAKQAEVNRAHPAKSSRTALPDGSHRRPADPIKVERQSLAPAVYCKKTTVCQA